MGDPRVLQTIMVILAIVNLIIPVVFYVLAYKLGRIFVTKEEFDRRMAEFETLNARLDRIDNHMLTVLQRTAHLRLD